MSLCEHYQRELPQYVSDGESSLVRYSGRSPRRSRPRSPTDVGDQDLRAHLALCAECREYARRLRLVEDALRTYPPVSPSADLAPLVMCRISAQGRKGNEEWHPFPWDVWVPSVAFVLALVLVVMFMPAQPLPAEPVGTLEGTLSRWPGAFDTLVTNVRALMSQDIFWAIWSGIFATTAGLGIGLSLSCWSALDRKRLEELQDRFDDMATRVRGRMRRAG